MIYFSCTVEKEQLINFFTPFKNNLCDVITQLVIFIFFFFLYHQISDQGRFHSIAFTSIQYVKVALSRKQISTRCILIAYSSDATFHSQYIHKQHSVSLLLILFIGNRFVAM